jgi:hypothetical protein
MTALTYDDCKRIREGVFERAAYYRRVHTLNATRGDTKNAMVAQRKAGHYAELHVWLRDWLPY